MPRTRPHTLPHTQRSAPCPTLSAGMSRALKCGICTARSHWLPSPPSAAPSAARSSARSAGIACRSRTTANTSDRSAT
eukprot:141448-Chlamydomonas_euryale.AAC.1